MSDEKTKTPEEISEDVKGRLKDFAQNLDSFIIEEIAYAIADDEENDEMIDKVIQYLGEKYEGFEDVLKACNNPPEELLTDIAEILSGKALEEKPPERMDAKEYRRWREKGGGR